MPKLTVLALMREALTNEWQHESNLFRHVRTYRASSEQEMRTQLAVLAKERYAEGSQFPGYRGVHWRRAVTTRKAA